MLGVGVGVGEGVRVWDLGAWVWGLGMRGSGWCLGRGDSVHLRRHQLRSSRERLLYRQSTRPNPFYHRND